MSWYEITQNNSGGSLTQDNSLTHRLFIEARTSGKAKEISIRMGVYFDGVNDGQDCSCCGDRWETIDEIEIPYRYGTFGKTIAERIADAYGADFGKTTWKFAGAKEPETDKYDVVFRDIESYAQYLADNYGSVEPDARVFYADGKIVEIRMNKENSKRNLI